MRGPKTPKFSRHRLRMAPQIFQMVSISMTLQFLNVKISIIYCTVMIWLPERSRCVLGVGVGAVREDDLLEIPVPHHAVDA